MIQEGPQNTGADKPLRISGEPFKVQVSNLTLIVHFCSVYCWFCFHVFLYVYHAPGLNLKHSCD